MRRLLLSKLCSVLYHGGLLILLIMLIMVLFGCVQPRKRDQFRQIRKDVHLVRPNQTDPSINTYLTPHIAYRNPRVPRKDRLFVYLSGTGAKPSSAKHLLKVVTDMGIPVISLSYPNEPSVRSLCQSDSVCYGRVRQEVIYGTDTSPLVNIDPANSIMNRLTRLLQYLNRRFPQEGWGDFLNGNRINWSKIIIAGHSQGGGHAAFIAKNHLVHRVVTFASPFDTPSEEGDVRIRPASWLFEPSVTPANHYYGFGHYNDFTLNVLVPIWRAQKYPGVPVNVDQTNPPYNHSHQLYTKKPPRTGNIDRHAHLSVVVDVATPLDRSGNPVYAPVWRYMCCSG